MNPKRNPCLRYAILAATTLAGLATVPTMGADAHLERPKPRVSLASADRWRLRPAQAVGVVPAAERGKRAAVAIPEERRHVRQVYPAFVEAR